MLWCCSGSGGVLASEAVLGCGTSPCSGCDGGKAGTAVSHLSSASLLFAGRGVGAAGVNRTRES